MKVNSKASKSIRGKSREATAVEKSINALVKKHGVVLVRYVANKIIRNEVSKIILAKEISVREKELAALKRKR